MTRNEASYWVPNQVARIRKMMEAGTFTFTFGVEMECCHLPRTAFKETARRNGIEAEFMGYTHRHTTYYKMVTDSSLVRSSSTDEPTECVSPILKGAEGFESLAKCCKTFAEVGAKVNKSCGLHVHIGTDGLTDAHICNIVVNYCHIEHIIDTFMAKSRRGNCRWAGTLLDHEIGLRNASDKTSLRRALDCNRYHKVNCEALSAHGTIEFRQHQGSLDYTKISNWVKFLGHLVEWSKDNRYDALCPVESIDDLEFLPDDLKAFFKGRAEALR